MKNPWIDQYGKRNFAKLNTENFFIIARELLRIHNVIDERDEFHYVHECVKEAGVMLNEFVFMTYMTRKGIYCEVFVQVITMNNMNMNFYVDDEATQIFQGKVGLHKDYYVFETIYMDLYTNKIPVFSYLMSVDTLESIDFYEKLEELEESTIQLSNIF